MSLNAAQRPPKRETRLRRFLTGRRLKGRNKRRDRKSILDVEKSIGWRIDSLLSVVAPVMAAKRMHQRRINHLSQMRFESLAAGFSGADKKPYREDRWLDDRRDVDSMMDVDISDLQIRSAELYRDNPIAHSAIEGRVANEIGVGIQYQPRIRPLRKARISERQASELNTELKTIADQWSLYGVDKSRQFTLNQFQKQVTRAYATFGEAFVLFGDSAHKGPLSFSMELIAPERVETPPDKANDPNVRLGIQYRGSVVEGYWVRSHHPGDEKNPGYDKYDFYPRFDENEQPRMVHVFDPLFANQSRGIPWLAAVMNRMKDLSDYWEAELVNKEVEACFGLVITGGKGTGSPQEAAEAAADRLDGGEGRNKPEVDLSPGAVNYLSEGEEPHPIDPSRPGATFTPFVELSLRSIAAALNYPYELLAKNFFRTTYSSGRLAMLDGRVGFRMRTQTVIDMWLVHVGAMIAHESIFRGLVDVDYHNYKQNAWSFTRHVWRAQNRGLLDPEKENKSHTIGLKGEFETKAGIAGDRGEEWEDVDEQLRIEGKRKAERDVQVALHRRKLEEAAGLQLGESLPADQRPGLPPQPAKSENKSESTSETKAAA